MKYLFELFSIHDESWRPTWKEQFHVEVSGAEACTWGEGGRSRGQKDGGPDEIRPPDGFIQTGTFC